MRYAYHQFVFGVSQTSSIRGDGVRFQLRGAYSCCQYSKTEALVEFRLVKTGICADIGDQLFESAVQEDEIRSHGKWVDRR